MPRTPQSQFLYQGYKSNLPTSFLTLMNEASGYSPWRPDADISTNTIVLMYGGRKISRFAACLPQTLSKKGARFLPGEKLLVQSTFASTKALQHQESAHCEGHAANFAHPEFLCRESNWCLAPLTRLSWENKSRARNKNQEALSSKTLRPLKVRPPDLGFA